MSDSEIVVPLPNANPEIPYSIVYSTEASTAFHVITAELLVIVFEDMVVALSQTAIRSSESSEQEKTVNTVKHKINHFFIINGVFL